VKVVKTVSVDDALVVVVVVVVVVVDVDTTVVVVVVVSGTVVVSVAKTVVVTVLSALVVMTTGTVVVRVSIPCVVTVLVVPIVTSSVTVLVPVVEVTTWLDGAAPTSGASPVKATKPMTTGNVRVSHRHIKPRSVIVSVVLLELGWRSRRRRCRERPVLQIELLRPLLTLCHTKINSLPR
jgi:hypothetical protein